MTAAVLALVLTGLAARGVGAAALPVTVAAGAASALVLPRSWRADAATWSRCVALGVSAFVAARLLFPGNGTTPARVVPIAASVVAALCEEVVFRGALYAWLRRFGSPATVAVSSVAFALVHVHAWGPAPLLLNLGAGALLGWQRWATGTWTAPAATHAAANLLQAL
jgi:membrane protease YdiL (CAAX protease family)